MLVPVKDGLTATVSELCDDRAQRLRFRDRMLTMPIGDYLEREAVDPGAVEGPDLVADICLKGRRYVVK